MNEDTSIRLSKPSQRFNLLTLSSKLVSSLWHVSLMRDANAYKRFKLLRSFSLVSLVACVAATGFLAVFYRQREVNDLIISAEETNVALTRVLANSLWQKYGPLLSSNQTLDNDALTEDADISVLYEEVLEQLEGLSVAKIKIYDLEGLTIFSTEESQIGEDKSQSSGFQSAKSGQVISQLEHRDTFKALQSTLADRHLLSSYIPVRTEGLNGDIIGVFELYTDVTPLVQRISQTQRDIVLGSLVIVAGLYGVLFLFIRRADSLLKKQYQELQASEDRYRRQAQELEQALTELHQTEAQMLQSEKMSSLGQLVAGVAHEVNNPVNFIHGNLSHIQTYCEDLLSLIQLYEKDYPTPSETIQTETDEIELDFIREDLPKTLSSMKIGTHRIREIVSSLRNFSRLDEAEIKPVDIHTGLESTLVILNHRLKARPERPAIQVIKDYGQLPLVECYAGLLNQVFMNILSNAIDALEDDMKQQTVETRKENPKHIRLHTSLVKSKEWVQIAIADNGSGMPQDVQKRVFEPFFTTKPVSKGTGMGMSISYQIVTDRHHGQLQCFSQTDKGTEFIIRIPLKQDQGFSQKQRP
ncbi:MAG: HAMP domain-containing histidine kinase [Leptolyngbya sp. SIO1D8]|nr:HAMP domain-containing histidine kinase [Leptolyngbya sp. SIO1D8]